VEVVEETSAPMLVSERELVTAWTEICYEIFNVNYYETRKVLSSGM
jgi:hypothetical protein